MSVEVDVSSQHNPSASFTVTQKLLSLSLPDTASFNWLQLRPESDTIKNGSGKPSSQNSQRVIIGASVETGVTVVFAKLSTPSTSVIFIEFVVLRRSASSSKVELLEIDPLLPSKSIGTSISSLKSFMKDTLPK